DSLELSPVILSPVECLACLSLRTMCDSVWVEKEIFPEEDVRFKPRLFYVRADDASVLQTHQHDVVYYGVVNLIDNNYVMGAVDVQTGQKHTTTTNAYQALGKPFSFTPPLSATTIAPSKYSILNLTSLLFLATTVWSIVLAVSSAGLPQSLATELRILFALVAAGTLGSTWMLSKRRLWSPLLGLGVAAIGLIVYAYAKIGAGFSVADYALSLLLLADIA